MLSQSDKITLTKYPPLPSVCAICKFSANGEVEFLDFEMSLDIYGAVVICERCIAPVAQLFGYVTSVELNNANSIIVSQQEELIEVREANARLNSTLDSILSLRPNVQSSDLSTPEVTDIIVTEDGISVELHTGAEGINDRESIESATERGLEDISQSGDSEHTD
jgi:hypothetical protein